jgi:ribosome-associated heat shock protein Hsp15
MGAMTLRLTANASRWLDANKLADEAVRPIRRIFGSDHGSHYYSTTRHTGKVVAEIISSDTLRIDKWLWAARFFKTRSLAAEAVVGGKVKVNGERVKAAKAVRVDDELRIQVGHFEYVIRVLDLSGRRGPASEAALLYKESAESKAARETLAAQLAATRVLYPRGDGRPTKKARREMIRFKKGE